MLVSAQIRMARAALGISIRELAEAASVAPSTIHRFEIGKGAMHTSTLGRVEKVLEDGGIIFISPDANGGPGVRLRA